MTMASLPAITGEETPTERQMQERYDEMETKLIFQPRLWIDRLTLAANFEIE